jgi:hypothetical protein
MYVLAEVTHAARHRLDHLPVTEVHRDVAVLHQQVARPQLVLGHLHRAAAPVAADVDARLLQHRHHESGAVVADDALLRDVRLLAGHLVQVGLKL